MNVIRYQPWSLLDQLHEQVNDLFDRHLQTTDNKSTALGRIPVDIHEEANSYIIDAEIAGINPDNVDISMEKNVLTIKGEHKQEEEKKEKNYIRRERVIGSFSRSFVMPNDTDAGNIKARYENGILCIEIPKQQKSASQKIKIEKIEQNGKAEQSANQ